MITLVSISTVFTINIVLWTLSLMAYGLLSLYLWSIDNGLEYAPNRRDNEQRLTQHLLGINRFGRQVQRPSLLLYPLILVGSATTMATFWLFTYILFLL
jgi:hypothetical protein